jgi:hypothetical protein
MIIGRSGHFRQKIVLLPPLYRDFGTATILAFRVRCSQRELCMQGMMEPKPPTRWPPEWNFGLIALVVLAAIAIAAALIMPEITTP